MKTKAISSFFVLFAIASVMAISAPDAFADHSEVSITTGPVALSVPGCEETNECYTPSTATVDVGGKVIMTNTDSTGIHTYTSGTVDGFAASPDDKFDSGILNFEQSFEWSPDTVGEYPYYCMLHVWMQGTIIVQEAEAEEDTHDEAEVDAQDEHDDGNLMVEGLGDDFRTTEDAQATGMLSDGTKVSVWLTTPTANEFTGISVEFEDAEHVNYDILVTQQGGEYMNDEAAHAHDGAGTHMTAPLSSSNPLDITITFQGYGVDDPKTGPIGEVVEFTNVVPEFGTIAMMILAVAIISIVAVTAKSRVVPRF